MLTSFLAFLFLFVIIGISAVKSSKDTTIDYLLAGHNVKPWLAGLSAVATNNSGYMFIGVIGYTYLTGLSAIWLMVGWITGDMLASFLMHKKLRQATGHTRQHSFLGVLSAWNGENWKTFRLVSGIASLIFLGSYAAAQFNAGSKALVVLFGWDIYSGALIGAVIVLLYCFSGGIRASIWTDAAQSFVMMIAMAIMFFVMMSHFGGWSGTFEKLGQVRKGFLNWFPQGLWGGPYVGAFLFITGWLFAGFGVSGQPHIMVRFMALDQSKHLTRTRWYYYSWFSVFYLLATFVGLFSRLYIPETANFDAELALPKIASHILNPVLTGIVLAGIFAATISTADSLILSCSATISQDIFPQKKFTYNQTKIATVVITVAALGIALFGEKSVFQLVILSWAVLSAIFTPLLLIHSLSWKITEAQALAVQFVSLAVLFTWRSLGLSAYIYELAPAISAGLVMYFLWRAAFFKKEDLKELKSKNPNKTGHK